MKNVWEHPLFTVLARLVVGAVFIGYGIDKIVAPKDFAHSILNYQILPPPAVNILALLLPWIEVTGGMMLIIGIRLRASAFLLGTLLVTFIVAIGTAMLRGLEINCGCSAHSEPVGLPKILEDCLYLVLCIRIMLYPHGLLTLESYVSASEGMATVSEGNEGSAS
ncbi:MAG: DoxX family protein [Candidatus Kapaibacterium sp.]